MSIVAASPSPSPLPLPSSPRATSVSPTTRLHHHNAPATRRPQSHQRFPPRVTSFSCHLPHTLKSRLAHAPALRFPHSTSILRLPCLLLLLFSPLSSLFRLFEFARGETRAQRLCARISSLPFLSCRCFSPPILPPPPPLSPPFSSLGSKTDSLFFPSLLISSCVCVGASFVLYH